MKIKLVYKGGPGSGNYGHEGRPGMVGGSQASGKAKGLYSPDEKSMPASVRYRIDNRTRWGDSFTNQLKTQKVGANVTNKHGIRLSDIKKGSYITYTRTPRFTLRQFTVHSPSLNAKYSSSDPSKIEIGVEDGYVYFDDVTEIRFPDKNYAEHYT